MKEAKSYIFKLSYDLDWGARYEREVLEFFFSSKLSLKDTKKFLALNNINDVNDSAIEWTKILLQDNFKGEQYGSNY